VESLRKICKILSAQQIEESFVPLVRTLSQADWFTSRSAATGLYGVMYERVNSSVQDHLRQWFAQLCQDDTPMVRREAASNLKVYALQNLKLTFRTLLC
jgi:serine/threonine-protein phosphatase 2A regulatory subunit A